MAFVSRGKYINNFISERLVVDPNYLESQAKEGDMSITMNVHREICNLSKAGGIPLEMDQVIRCSKIASVKVSTVDELIKKVLEQDKEAR